MASKKESKEGYISQDGRTKEGRNRQVFYQLKGASNDSDEAAVSKEARTMCVVKEANWVAKSAQLEL